MIKLNLFTKQKQTHRLKKTNLQLLVGDVWEEGMVRESGMDMPTLLYLKWITNKHLLYSTGNSAQCYAWKREWIHGCLWLSPFCCPPKNYHNIVNQLYSIQKKKLFKKKIKILEEISRGFPGGSEVKASACNEGDLDSIPGSGRSPGEGNGSPLQYSCLENPMDRGAGRATVHRVAKSRTRLSNFTFIIPRRRSGQNIKKNAWFKFSSPSLSHGIYYSFKLYYSNLGL